MTSFIIALVFNAQLVAIKPKEFKMNIPKVETEKSNRWKRRHKKGGNSY